MPGCRDEVILETAAQTLGKANSKPLSAFSLSIVSVTHSVWPKNIKWKIP